MGSNRRTRAKAGRFVLEVCMVLLSLIFLYPIFLTIINSFKSFGEVMTDVVALPKGLALENYSYVWEFINYPRLFLNNGIITVVGLVGIIFISSLAAYKLSRTKSRLSIVVYFLHYADARSIPVHYANRTTAGKRFAFDE